MDRIYKSLLFVLLITPMTVQGIKVPGLYEAEVSVADQDVTNRKLAIKMALHTVLVKLTGDRFAPGRIALDPIMSAPENYLQQFRYRESVRQAVNDNGKDETELLLWVRFDESTLNKALRDLSVPVWGRERPSTLIWLVIDDQSSRRMLVPHENPEIIRALDYRARQRGIALIYPLHDLEDTANLKISDIWGEFKEPVLNASQRYQADTVLTVSIESSITGIWEGRWTAYIDGQTSVWLTEGDIIDLVLDEGVDGMADRLANRFARASGFSEQASVEINVADVFNTDQYAKTLKYLGSLISVDDVQVIRVEEGNVSFRLNVHGGKQAVMQAIALGRVLEAVGEKESGTYRLLP